MKYADRLWIDFESDLERAEFIECGLAWETGIIAREIESDVAEAFRFRHDARARERASA